MKVAVDSSAIVAIILSEPEADSFQAFLATNEPITSGHVLIEVLMVLTGRAVDSAKLAIDIVIAQTGIEVAPFDARMADIAQQAFLDFGKGRHPARLNFGDCMSYALAKSLRIPLLWKGNDFDLTDIERVG